MDRLIFDEKRRRAATENAAQPPIVADRAALPSRSHKPQFRHRYDGVADDQMIEETYLDKRERLF
jgi:hypothetical protein